MPTAIPIFVALDAAEWARAIAALPAVGPLPVRTGLVPNGRVAHSLRRELLRAGLADTLAGTLFRPIHLAAEDVLHATRVEFTAGEEALRPARLTTLFREPLTLEYFDPSLLRTARGWEEAFARTIFDLEVAGLRPGDLPTAKDDDSRWRDVATVWRCVDELAGTSWSTPRIILEAATRIEVQPHLWPHDGATLAPVASDITPTVARLLRAIPGVQLVLLTARPLRRRYLERIELLFGTEARAKLDTARVPRRAETEKQILESYLFEPGDVLGDPTRARSSGPDGTVHLEEHAGLEEEIEAAVRWVAREVLERRTPLEDIAVLTPTRDHVVDLLASRIGSLQLKGDEGFPVFVAGGRPLVSFAGGARVLAVVRALRRHLAVESLVPVLPAFKLVIADGNEAARLTHDRAIDLAYGLGTVGGNPAHPHGALEWAARLGARRAALERRLASGEARGADNSDRDARDRRDAERTLDAIQSVTPALSALVEVARRVVERETLDIVWGALRAFLSDWVAHSVGRFDIVPRIEQALAPLCADARCAALAGEDALSAIEDVLLAIRVASGRFGEPAVYVGTIDGALGLRFSAVRVIGLLEGALPAQPHEDPVLPDATRETIPTLSRAEDRAIAQLHALDRVVRDAERVVLSTPHLDASRVEREPSSVFIEAAAALGRPNAVTGESTAETPVPDMTALRRDAFAPARCDAESFSAANPLTAADWQDLVARHGPPLPSRWHAGGALDLERIRALRTPDAAVGPLDGFLEADRAVFALIPGLTDDHPTSASALKTLLECPHRFLLERVLRFTEPTGPASLGEIDGLTYGRLFHEVIEALFGAHGEDLCSRARDVEHWHGIARDIATRKLADLLQTYPLTGEHVRAQQRARLLRDVACFLDYEVAGAPRSFVRVELPFGYDEPLALDLEGGPLFVHGFIDRIDVEDGRTLVRDLKTGKAHPRSGKEAAADHRRDVQLALYGMVLRQLAGTLGLPTRVAAAYVHMDPHEPERAFRVDFDALETEARAWLSAARQLLANAAFPRTPDPNDCRYCPFTPVCGANPYPRALEVLNATTEVTATFDRMKAGTGDEPTGGDED